MKRKALLQQIDRLAQQCSDCPNNHNTPMNCKLCPAYRKIRRVGKELLNQTGHRREVAALLSKGEWMTFRDIERLKELGVTLSQIGAAIGIPRSTLGNLLERRAKHECHHRNQQVN